MCNDCLTEWNGLVIVFGVNNSFLNGIRNSFLHILLIQLIQILKVTGLSTHIYLILF